MDISKLTEGLVIKDYKQLCSLIGEKVKSGNSKESQMKELRRWVDLEQIKYQFKVNSLRATIMPKDDSRDIYKQHLQFILLDYIARFGNAELTKSQIMLMCGMCNPRYFALQQDEYLKAQQLKRTQFSDVTEFDLKDFYRRTGLKFSKMIDSAVVGLGSNYCYCLVRKGHKIHTHMGTHIATLEEEKLIVDVKRKVLNSMGLSNVGQVFRKFKQKEFFNEVNQMLSSLYEWTSCYAVYQILPTKMIRSNLNHFVSTLDQKQQELFVLNQKCIKYCKDESLVVYENNKRSIAATPLGFKLSSKYVQAQEVLCEYLLEI